MQLRQLQALKRWHVAHRPDHPIEYEVWDAVLMLWVLGWIGEPASLILQLPAAAIACIALFLMPTLYVRARLLLHRAGRLRCDWVSAITR